MRKAFRYLIHHIDMVAIIIASLAAIVLHYLHLIPEEYLISFVLVLLAIHTAQEVIRGEEVRNDVRAMGNLIATPEPEVAIVKPAEILRRTEEFGMRNAGEDWWFNACATMFRSQHVFDKLLKSSMLNPKTTRIFFVLKPSMKEAWDRDVAPKIERSRCKEKVQPVLWRDIAEGIAFRTIDVDSGTGAKEALLTVWGEPFMMEHVDERGSAQMPRYVMHVRRDSELLVRLHDLLQKHRMASS